MRPQMNNYVAFIFIGQGNDELEPKKEVDFKYKVKVGVDCWKMG